MRQKLIPYQDADGKIHDHYFVDAKTGIIYFKKDHEGKRHKFTTKCLKSEFIKAKRYANKEFSRRIGPKKKITIRPLIKDELPKWVTVKESEGLAYDTMNNIKRAKRQIEEFWGDKFTHEIDQDNVAVWITFWRANHPNIDMENAIKYFRNFCNYLSKKGIDGVPLLPIVPTITDPEYKKIKARRIKAKEIILDGSDLKRIITSAENEEHKLVALFMYTMATRIDETLKLRFGEEIILDKEVPEYKWTVGQNKADLWGYHALHPVLIEPLKALREIRKAQGTNRLFPQKNNTSKGLSSQQIDWDEWRKRADISFHWTPHTFRHTCLSNLFNDAKNPQAIICKLYRVSLQTAMQTYIKANDEGRRQLRDALKVDL